MPRTSYAELPEPTASAVNFACAKHGPALAAAVAKRLDCHVSFSHWQPPTRANGPETPVFVVPTTHTARAIAMGLTVVHG
jgi:hypothetical protein